MVRLFIHVEGDTEELFVNHTLAPHLYSCGGFASVSAKKIGLTRSRAHRGGIKGWDAVRTEIISFLKQDAGLSSTTIVDYYALPKLGLGAWPGRAAAELQLTSSAKAETIEKALAEDLAQCMGARFSPARFVPFIMMHEFEALLFSDCGALAEAIKIPNLAATFQTVRNAFVSPEEINDSYLTAPSKRITQFYPKYSKTLAGNLAIKKIGLAAIRRECPHFADWLTRLEALATV